MMPEPVSALNGRRDDSAVILRDAGLVGMITLRGDLADARLRAAVKKATGQGVPKPGRIALAEGRAAAWMSPDELLLIVPHADAEATVAQIGQALAGLHHLVVNVSDARALIELSGPGAREVLAKVTPADLHPGSFGPGQIRRSRLAQVAAAFWLTDAETLQVVCFRSVADYVFDLLAKSARDGAVGYF
jgi:sarcosine oxidase subunit gamma